MSRKLKRMRQKGRSGKFVMLPEWLMKTQAWKSLSPNARCVWIELMRRYKGPATNNGDLYLSAREAGDAIAISHVTASRAFIELQEKGFIRATQKAGFEWRDGKQQRRAQRYAVTHEPVGNALATKDFLKWQPPLPANVISLLQSKVADRHNTTTDIVSPMKQ